MLSHRIIPGSAVLLAVTIGSAAAQVQTSAGKPLQLLQFARHDVRHEAKQKTKHEAKAPLRPHARAAEKPSGHAEAAKRAELSKHAEAKPHIAKVTVAKHQRLFAAVHHHRLVQQAEARAQPPAPQPAEPAQQAPAAAQASIWPAVDAAAPGSIAVPAPAAAPQNVKTEPVVSDAPNAIAPDVTVTETAPPPPAVSAPAVAADAHPPAAAPTPDNGTAAALNKITAAEPVVRAMMVKPAPPDSAANSSIGSAPWLLQVLAALGGAAAAGAVAWFLILRGQSKPADDAFFAEGLAPGE